MQARFTGKIFRGAYLSTALFLQALLLGFPRAAHAQDVLKPLDNGLYVAPIQNESAAVTGEVVYPTPLVLSNLGLPNLIDEELESSFVVQTSAVQILSPEIPSTMMEPDDLDGKRVLSLGEGFSGLVPYLRKLGANAYGLDLWYDPSTPIPNSQINSPFMAAYRKKYQTCLIEGDATNLCGFESASFDLVVSHKLFGYLNKDQRLEMVKESVRILGPGGSVHFDMADDYSDPAALTALKDALRADGYDDLIVSLYEISSTVNVSQPLQPVCSLIETFSADEFEAIVGALDFAEKPAGMFFPKSDTQNLLIITKAPAPEASATPAPLHELSIENTPQEEIVKFLNTLEEQSPLTLNDFNSLVKRRQASGIKLDRTVLGLRNWINILSSRQGTTRLIPCYGFVDMWQSMGSGDSEKDRLESGLEKWRNDLRTGKPVNWPTDSSSCSTLHGSIDLSTGSIDY